MVAGVVGVERQVGCWWSVGTGEIYQVADLEVEVIVGLSASFCQFY